MYSVTLRHRTSLWPRNDHRWRETQQICHCPLKNHLITKPPTSPLPTLLPFPLSLLAEPRTAPQCFRRSEWRVRPPDRHRLSSGYLPISDICYFSASKR